MLSKIESGEHKGDPNFAKSVLDDINTLKLDGFEADDLIGTLSRQAELEKIPTIILTGDSDLLQLVSPSVKVVMNNTQRQQKIYDIEEDQS